MKKCPTCDKTFDDGMRFCQTDGTPLVEAADVTNKDPYKTTAASQDEIASAIPIDPFKTMVAPPSKKVEKEILELPEEPDFLKTMVSTSKDYRKSEPSSNEDNLNKVSSPSPFGDAMKPTSSANDAVPQADPGYAPINENPAGLPIPSPFDESMGDYQAPSRPMPPFDEPEPLPVGGNDPFQSPFNQPPSPLVIEEVKAEALNSPYAEQVEDQINQPIEQSNWTPPPAPDANWQNQQIGQNTPFQPPPAGQGQNQTLAIVSLVSGILSMLCCFSIITGPAGLITGFMAKKNVEQNPNEYGGRSLALGGIVTGAIGTVIFIILFILQIFFGVLGGILGNM